MSETVAASNSNDLSIFFRPGDVQELRCLSKKKTAQGKHLVQAGYFKDFKKLEEVINITDKTGEHQGIYFVLNQINPALYARKAEAICSLREPIETTKDEDIQHRHWLPIDFDPVRPSGISSSDEEHLVALTKAKECREWLRERNWPDPVYADSGNGAHLDYPIDLPNDTKALETVTLVLNALADQFNDDKITVDEKNLNAARIWKAYGTIARKGENLPERPWRRSTILEVPDKIIPVPEELLADLAWEYKQNHVEGEQNYSGVGHIDNIESWLTDHKITWSKTKAAHNDGTTYVLDECPSCHNTDACCHVSAYPPPKNGFHAACKHNHCDIRHWNDFRKKIEPDYVPYTYGYSKNEADVPPDDEGVTEEEFQKLYGVPCGPRFEVKLPKDHFLIRYMAYGQDVSDGYPEYWFIGGLHALAVVSDKKIIVKLRQMVIYPNLYLTMLGKSTISRKSTISDKTEDLLMEVWPFLINAKVPTEFSPEAFIEHMNDYPHCPWIRDESAGVLNLMKKDYMRGFKEILMTFYDCRAVHRKLRTSQRKNSVTDFNVSDPYLNILFATTPESFAANTELIDTLSGFLARFLYALPQRPKGRYMPLEKGNAITSDLETVVKDQLQAIAGKCCNIKQTDMDLSPESKTFFDAWQKEREQTLDKANDEFGAQIFGRLAPTVLKFCMLFELGSPDFYFDKPEPIRLEFIQEACRLVDEYFTITAKAVYEMVGSDLEKNQIVRIKTFLTRRGGKATAREILKYLQITKDSFLEYLDTMVASGEVNEVMIANKGARPSQYVCLNKGSVESVYNVESVEFVESVEEIPRNNDVRNLFDKQDKHDKHDKHDAHDKAGNSSLKAIYRSTGAALEYAELSLNLYAGCSHQCVYCFNRGKFRSPCTETIKKASLENIEHDLKQLVALENKTPVHLSFIGDPFDLGRSDNSYTDRALELFKKYQHPFQILTKGGMKAIQEPSVYFDGCSLGCTLTFDNPVDSKKWEPGAALPEDRIATLELAHKKGIKTWVSLEPVIDPFQSLHLIDITHGFVDFYGVGKINHNAALENAVDWSKFRADVEAKLKGYGKAYKIKAALEKAAPKEVLKHTCYKAILRAYAITEYGINGWVDPIALSAKVELPVCLVKRGLEHLGYRPFERQEGGIGYTWKAAEAST